MVGIGPTWSGGQTHPPGRFGRWGGNEHKIPSPLQLGSCNDLTPCFFFPSPVGADRRGSVGSQLDPLRGQACQQAALDGPRSGRSPRRPGRGSWVEHLVMSLTFRSHLAYFPVVCPYIYISPCSGPHQGSLCRSPSYPPQCITYHRRSGGLEW